MPGVNIVLFREDDGTVPLLEWLDGLSPQAVAKCHVRLERLREIGHELRRPEADYLQDGIYELRVSVRRVQYRMLYFFHGRTAAVVSHGIVKGRLVPLQEIERAVRRKLKFERNPQEHTHSE